MKSAQGIIKILMNFYLSSDMTPSLTIIGGLKTIFLGVRLIIELPLGLSSIRDASWGRSGVPDTHYSVLSSDGGLAVP